MDRRRFLTALAGLVASLWDGLTRKPAIVPPPLPAPLPLPKLIVSEYATPGRIDFINLKDWVWMETKPTDYYDLDAPPVVTKGDSVTMYFNFLLACPMAGESSPTQLSGGA